jgi:hypothetical protein
MRSLILSPLCMILCTCTGFSISSAARSYFEFILTWNRRHSIFSFRSRCTDLAVLLLPRSGGISRGNFEASCPHLITNYQDAVFIRVATETSKSYSSQLSIPAKGHSNPAHHEAHAVTTTGPMVSPDYEKGMARKGWQPAFNPRPVMHVMSFKLQLYSWDTSIPNKELVWTLHQLH